jgi:hypothetical protein
MDIADIRGANLDWIQLAYDTVQQRDLKHRNEALGFDMAHVLV